MRIQLMFLLFVLLPCITKSQILAGTDDLGRILPQNNSVGNPKSNRQVGIFYFLWQGDDTAENYWDLSEIVPNHPEVLEDYDNVFWGLPVYKPGGPVGMYFWGKPIYGYYRGNDYWVHLRSILKKQSKALVIGVMFCRFTMITLEIRRRVTIRVQNQNQPQPIPTLSVETISIY